MPHSSPKADFKIHVDPSCLTDSSDLKMSAERDGTAETTARHATVEDDPGEEIESKANGARNNIADHRWTRNDLQVAIDELQQAIDEPQASTHEESQETKDNESEHLDYHVPTNQHADTELSSSHENDNEGGEYTDEGSYLESVNSSYISDDDDAAASHDGTESSLQHEEETVASETGDDATEVVDMHSQHDESFDDSIDDSQDDEHSNSEHNNHGSGTEHRRPHDEHTEALIQSAARAIVASIEHGHYDEEDSVLSTQPTDSYIGRDGTELTYGAMELTYDGSEAVCENEDGHTKDEVQEINENISVPEVATVANSTQDIGLEVHDIEPEQNDDKASESGSGGHGDEVFSQDERSHRSSLQSCDGLHLDEKHIEDPDVAISQEEVSLSDLGHADYESVMEPQMQPISRIASNYSTLAPEHSLSPPIAPSSKTLSRPPFRTPSSVRAIQMSSPSPSVRPSVSRLGTPIHTPKSTSARFKFKKEYPLILLHVTVMPLQWQYSPVMEMGDALPEELRRVRENWRLLQDNSNNTVLERGILLPHPQDSYEVLEERLLDALELPVPAHARILKCGHYMPLPEDSDSGDDDEDKWDDIKSCIVCGRVVRYEEILKSDNARENRFRIKVYASNGLMRAGAWAAAWREMERVDVEIEPFVPSDLMDAMERLLIQLEDQESHEIFQQMQQTDESLPLLAQGRTQDKNAFKQEDEDTRRRRESSEERLREIYGEEAESKIATSNPRPRSQGSPRLSAEHDRPSSQTRNESHFARVSETDRPLQEEPPISRSQSASMSEKGPRRRTHENASLLSLIIAAARIFIRDRKNILIMLLTALVFVLALRPGASVPDHLIAEPTTVGDRDAPAQSSHSTDMSSADVKADSSFSHDDKETQQDESPDGSTQEIIYPLGAGQVLQTPTQEGKVDYEVIKKIIEDQLRPILSLTTTQSVNPKPEASEAGVGIWNPPENNGTGMETEKAMGDREREMIDSIVRERLKEALEGLKSGVFVETEGGSDEILIGQGEVELDKEMNAHGMEEMEGEL
jgi:hypothetical protein